MDNRYQDTSWNPYPPDVEGVECRKLAFVHNCPIVKLEVLSGP
jgi:hypothetical protein